MSEPDNTPRRPTLFDYNPYAKPVVPSRQMERFSEKYNEINVEADRNNKELNDETERLRHKTVFVYCPMCQGKLDRKHGKDKEVEIGYGIIMNVQKWSCSICKSGYVGYLPNVYHEDNPNLKANVVEYPQ